MKLRTALLAFLITMPVAAAQSRADNVPEQITVATKVANASQAPGCPNPNALRGICMFVGSGTEDRDPQGQYQYLYQRKFFEAACVEPIKDNAETIQKKMQAMWSAFEDKLICNNPRFDVQNGSIIKFGVNVQFDRFIYDVADWKVNLNRVDEWDNMTVLDYVKKEMDRHKGNSLEKNLKSYYSALKEAGAKHKSEL